MKKTGLFLVDNREEIDRLYLDNTYNEPSCQFPRQEEAQEEVLALAERYWTKDKCSLLIGVDSLGKEDLLIELSQRLGVALQVSRERFDSMFAVRSELGFADSDGEAVLRRYFCVCDDEQDPDAERPFVRVVGKRSISEAVLRRDGQLAAIVPSAFPWRDFHSERIHFVGYSLHSTYAELAELVRFVRPRAVHPIVTRYRTDMSRFADDLSPRPPSAFEVPAVLRLSATSERAQPSLCKKAARHSEEIRSIDRSSSALLLLVDDDALWQKRPADVDSVQPNRALPPADVDSVQPNEASQPVALPFETARAILAQWPD